MFRFELFCDDKLVVPLLKQLGSTKGVYMRTAPTPVVGATVENGKMASKPSAGVEATILAIPSANFSVEDARKALEKAGLSPNSTHGTIHRLVVKKLLKKTGPGKYRKAKG
jgi:hypothetical protein